MQQLKIGQKLVVQENYEISTCISNTNLQVKKGDVGFIDANGMIHYLSGQARGKIHNIADVEVKGYDIENIAELIFRQLKSDFHINDILEDYDIDVREFKDSIEDILSEIL